MTARVSILIPCYNAEPWIGQAIETALAQSWPDKEVIVVDDGSTDKGLEVIRRYAGRIKWETGPNRGGNPTRNRLLELSSGEWLQYLDADDYLLAPKVADQMACASATPGADVIYGPWTVEHMKGEGSFTVPIEIPEPHDPWVLLLRWYLPQTTGVLWRRAAVVDAGGWKPTQPCCQEYELYLRLLAAGRKFAFCPARGAVYRQWGDHTVWKKDVTETIRRRNDIVRDAEAHLKDRGELTAIRLEAMNQGRFESARLAWRYDPKLAQEIFADIERSEPRFSPRGRAASPLYRFAFHSLGFRTAERIAQLTRR